MYRFLIGLHPNYIEERLILPFLDIDSALRIVHAVYALIYETRTLC